MTKRLINLPYAPTAVQWTTVKQPSRDDWSLQALIALKPGDTAKLMTESVHDVTRVTHRRYRDEGSPGATSQNLPRAE